MSYQVIARKWRPKSFEQVVGQSHISQTLLNALKNNRLPHALLFTGPRGTGKTSSARILAKALRCPNAKNFVPCSECDECNEVAAGNSVNVIEIDGASNNGVEAIRELRESVGYMPSSGKYKVYIIDEVHMLSTSAFNALLKTLEEPPEHVIFVMATTEAQKIPNTILSRCQRFDFRRIPLKLVVEHLHSICQADAVQAEADALWIIARQGDGSMRDAQSLLDQVITFSDKKITLEKVISVLGLTDRALLLNTVEALIGRQSAQVLNIIEDFFKSGFDPKVFIQDLLEEIRNLLLIKMGGPQASKIVDLPDAEIEKLSEISNDLSEEDIHLLFDMALKGGQDIPRAQDPRIVLEMVLLRMANAPRIENLLQMNTSSVKKKSSTNPTTLKPSTRPVVAAKKPLTPTSSKPKMPKPAPQPTPAAPAPTAQVARPTPKAPKGTPVQIWEKLVMQIKTENGLLGAQLENTYMSDFENKKLSIGVPPKVTFLYEKLTREDVQKKLQNYLNTYWGEGYSFEVIKGEEKKSQVLTPKAIGEQKLKDDQADLRKKVEEHPLIQATNKVFKTQITSIKEMSK